ncbi:hypothetical protein LINPERPRIM_LOCUS280 [Linum perenne]
MILRIWVSGIKHIDKSPKEVPVWLAFKKVPPLLITLEGVSWLANQVGQPINKFVRDGLDIKVCVIKDLLEDVKMSLEVVLDGGGQQTIHIEYLETRNYKRKGQSIGIANAKPSVSQQQVFIPI